MQKAGFAVCGRQQHVLIWIANANVLQIVIKQLLHLAKGDFNLALYQRNVVKKDHHA
jgi:hypothetical protein